MMQRLESFGIHTAIECSTSLNTSTRGRSTGTQLSRKAGMQTGKQEGRDAHRRPNTLAHWHTIAQLQKRITSRTTRHTQTRSGRQAGSDMMWRGVLSFNSLKCVPLASSSHSLIPEGGWIGFARDGRVLTTWFAMHPLALHPSAPTSKRDDIFLIAQSTSPPPTTSSHCAGHRNVRVLRPDTN